MAFWALIYIFKADLPSKVTASNAPLNRPHFLPLVVFGVLSHWPLDWLGLDDLYNPIMCTGVTPFLYRIVTRQYTALCVAWCTLIEKSDERQGEATDSPAIKKKNGKLPSK